MKYKTLNACRSSLSVKCGNNEAINSPTFRSGTITLRPSFFSGNRYTSSLFSPAPFQLSSLLSLWKLSVYPSTSTVVNVSYTRLFSAVSWDDLGYGCHQQSTTIAWWILFNNCVNYVFFRGTMLILAVVVAALASCLRLMLVV